MAQQQQSSPMSITQLCNSTNEMKVHSPHSIDDTDPDVRLAAEALGDMANAKNTSSTTIPITLPPLSTHHPSAPSTTPSSPLPTPTSSSLSNSRFSFSSDTSSITSQEDEYYHKHRSQHHQPPQKHLVHQMVESFAAPIYDKFGRRSSESSEVRSQYSDHEDEAALAAASALARASLNDTWEPPRENIRRRRPEDPRDDKLAGKKSRSRSASRSTSPHRPYTLTPKSPTVRHAATPIPRSRWQQIVLHAGSAAGTTAAVISEESMKCLRYCLSWLQYAIQHIERQMAYLRSYLVSLASNKNKSKEVVQKQQQDAQDSDNTLASIKKEMVDTVRKVVDVISRYASSSLPEQAKNAVRGSILQLPARWKMVNSSTSASPVAGSSSEDPQLHETSIKLLNFGGESIEMLQSVSNVFSDTVDRAELWLQRLRVVGVAGPQSSRRQQKQKQSQQQSKDESMEMKEPSIKDRPKQMVSADDMDTS
ncbi:transcription factor Opi1-domain-containing protein [Phascolomyces articulosus]|uniref:Transcription factor Opi1-domain-containing protein n=1 Tax=Phascolomyces articulosus TaxID=60185 RepID=A0AAD5JPY9_9FUNG|nr:transcription factor Opi1-domain-containing protein [Phascolomyces articulosus]